MKTLLATRTLAIPEGVEVEVNARCVKVKGPLGTLERNFKHVAMNLSIVDAASLDFTEEDGDKFDCKYIKVDMWFASKKQLACCRTIVSHIDNLFVGVTRGFTYKMRFVYSHFPINVALTGNVVEIRNFLGEKRVRKVEMLPGVSYVRSNTVKDEIHFTGIDIAAVSLTAAKVQQITNIRKKDLRKFLDGIYVSEKGPSEITE
uniref:Large ribosomal subunit protein uL6 alpha-beta domain-containing protein n=1 Tax=Amphora coffeiformis TaxID=265554 RepID=A0A7S3L0N5_9STRA|mmetsp:Transcript_9443/g.18067  ORF Transcript_9443/g.18067 Transcript_9443/m.18067 type:complete len:203 (+) Transcript_9443:109-717(+)|eukprot:scaffold2510_cov169-Amphora_coffeaeformis.AAC.40